MENSAILIMAADPASSRNDGWADVMRNCSTDGGLTFSRIDVCDNRDLSLIGFLFES